MKEARRQCERCIPRKDIWGRFHIDVLQNSIGSARNEILCGRLDGRVLNFNHRAPVLGAGIPTSPAPGTYATDGNGAFTLSNINSRTYKISVRKPGSRPKILSVAVRVDETIQGTIYLERDDETNQVDSLTAEIVNWPNRLVNSDTAYVDVVYRTRNAGTTDLSSYGVYVRIEQRTAPTSEKSRERTCPLSG